jgi:hypothetical protein
MAPYALAAFALGMAAYVLLRPFDGTPRGTDTDWRDERSE